MLEVELKARLEGNIESIKNQYEKILGVKAHAFKKKDFYYRKEKFFFRIRQYNEELCYLTFKEKSFHAMGEVNKEWETEIESFENLRNFLSHLNLYPLYEKVKEGYAFSLPKILVELCTVKFLGLFVELETTLDIESSAQEIKIAQKKLKKILKKLGINDQQIEEKSYQELLGY